MKGSAGKSGGGRNEVGRGEAVLWLGLARPGAHFSHSPL